MEEQIQYISLQEATQYCSYSRDYLKLRARQGKLKAVKIGRNWITKKEWVKDYVERAEEYNNNNLKAKKLVPPAFVKTTAGRPPANLPIEEIARVSPVQFRPALAITLAFVLLIAGGVLGKTSFENVFGTIDNTFSMMAEKVLKPGQELAAISSPDVLKSTLNTFKEFGQWITLRSRAVLGGLKSFAQGIRKIPQTVTGLFKKEIVIEKPKEEFVKKEEMENLLRQAQDKFQKELKELKERPAEEVEVSKITKIEPIKEITKETITLDSESLKEIQAILLQQQTDVGRLQLAASHGYINLPSVVGPSGAVSLTTLGTITAGTWQASSIEDAYVVDDLTIASTGRATFSKAPTQDHTGTWAIGSLTWNQADAAIYINPASATADSNLIGVAVADSVVFSLDAEGDIYGRNLVLTGSTTTGATTIAGDLSIEGNTIIGDSTTDTLTINSATLTWAGGNKTIDITGAATRTLTLLNSTASQVADLDLSDGSLKTAGTSRLTNAGALENITGLTSSGTITFSGLTSNGLVKTSGGTGELSIDTTSYQPAGTYVASVTGTSPITSSGGTTPAIGITQTSIANLNSALATGLLKITTGTGLLSSAVAGTDYQAAGSYITALTGEVTAAGPGSAAATIASQTSATWLGKVSDATGTGQWVFGTAPTFTTSIISPIVYGSSSANGTLTLQGNSASTGNTLTNANLSFKVGDSGATTALTILNNGNVGIGVTGPGARLDVLHASSPQLRLTQSDGTVYTEFQVAVTTGDLTVSSVTGDDVIFSDHNLFICEAPGCPSPSFSTDGNLIVETDIYAAGYRRASCPTGMIEVPPSPQDGMDGFCVDKYEAKSVGGIATSQAALTPWVSITQYNARAECIRAGKHLITEKEWQAIAHNVENVGWNWNGGVAGTNQMSDGHSDSVPDNSLAASTDSDPCYGTGQTCSETVWDSQRRTYKLSNGQYIWDLGGDVWQWVDQVNEDEYPVYNSPAAGWVACSTSGDGICGNTLTTNDQWYRGATTLTRGFIRGGRWNYGVISGAFTLYLGYAPTFTSTIIGFRCAR